MPISDLYADVARAEQERQWLCGAACSVMYLSKYDVAATQELAYSQIHDPNRFQIEKLYSDPKGISTFLKSTNLPHQVGEFSVAEPKVLADRLCQTIVSGQPAIVLVLGGDHWIVVEGVRLGLDDPLNPKILGFYVENPWKGKSSGMYISADEWFSRYATPNKWGVTWKNQHVLVAGAEVKQGNSTPALFESVGVRLFDAIIDFRVSNNAIRANALTAAAQHGFNDLVSIVGGGAAVTQAVRVLDETSFRHYWVVPLDGRAQGNFKDFVYAAVSDEGGVLLELVAMSNALQILSDEEATALIYQEFGAGTEFELGGHVLPSSTSAVSRFDVARRVLFKDGRVINAFSDGSAVVAQENSREAGG